MNDDPAARNPLSDWADASASPDDPTSRPASRGNGEPRPSPNRFPDSSHRSDPTVVQAEDDPRLFAVVQEFVQAVEAGKKPNRREFIARHPDLAPELSACLQGVAFLNSAVAGLEADSADLDPAASPLPQDELTGGRPLGDFRLIREIGRGGMGVVYEAEQLSLGRLVALKVLPLAAALDARHLQRFRNEAQAAAHLHHSNIVPVYAVGCERSVHFYAMQLIDGQSLAEVIASMRERGGEATDPASPKAQPALKSDSGPADDQPFVDDPVQVEDQHGVAAEDAASTGPSRLAPIPPSKLNRSTPSRAAPSRAAPSQGTLSPAAPSRSGFSRLNASRSATSKSSASRSGLLLPAAPGKPAELSSPDQLSVLRGPKRSSFHRAVAELGRQAANALDYAHQQGVVHRDVKPANLMLDLAGKLWITDFGLAQMYVDTGLTQPGDMLGTLRYMSPEQASGRAVVLDHRTDIYSLGVTLYELLTLRRAFTAEAREPLIYAIANEEPDKPRSIDRHIPVEMETILGKAMAKSPGERYQSCAEMADDLRRFLADEPILARPPSLLDKAVKWTRRHRVAAAVTVSLLVLIAIGLAVSTVLIAREQALTAAAYAGEQQKAREARLQRRRAEASRMEAHQLIGAFTQFAAAEVPKDPRFVLVRRRMLQTALAYNRSFIADRENDPAFASELAEARTWASTAEEELQVVDEVTRTEFLSALLVEPSVRNDLGLSDSDGQATRTLAIRYLQSPVEGVAGDPATVEETGSPDPSQRRKNVIQNARSQMAALAKALTPRQLDRLQQISRQARGVFAFSDPEVALALVLTPEQTQIIRDVEGQVMDFGPRSPDEGFHKGPFDGADFHGFDPNRFSKGRHGPPSWFGRNRSSDGPAEGDNASNEDADTFRDFPPPGDAAPGRETARSIDSEEGVKKVLATLTPKQSEVWKTLTGPIYEGPFPKDAMWAPASMRSFHHGGPPGMHHGEFDPGPPHGRPDDHDHGPDGPDFGDGPGFKGRPGFERGPDDFPRFGDGPGPDDGGPRPGQSGGPNPNDVGPNFRGRPEPRGPGPDDRDQNVREGKPGPENGQRRSNDSHPDRSPGKNQPRDSSSAQPSPDNVSR